MARQLYEAGEFVAAERACRAILKAQPDHAPTLHLLGKINMRFGVVAVAVSLFGKAAAAAPTVAAYHVSLGEALQGRGKWTEASECFRRAVVIDPAMARAHHRLGVSLQVERRWGEAEAAFQEALRVNPTYAKAQNALGVVFMSQGRLEEADIAFRRAMELDPLSPSPASHLLFALHYMPWYSRELAFDEARSWGEKFAQPLGREIQPHVNVPDPNRRLRIGYISGDFNHHPVGHILEPVLLAHDRDQFEIYCYMTSHQMDDVTARVRTSADYWRNLVRETDEGAHDLIRRDGIDILVDLSGHTSGSRLLVLARKPAPVQALWLGYFDTTGVSAIDYILADNVVVPGDEERYYVEKVVRLPDAWWCYQPPTYSEAYDQPVRELPARANGYVTFGCFNNAGKVTSEVVALWAAIMRQVPESRICLRNSAFDDNEVQDRYCNLFAQHGVTGNRVYFAPRVGYTDYLAAYGEVDIALDPFPYNGGMTSMEALWMGVPLITLRGDRFVGRLGCTLLNSIGATELIADSKAEYVAKAVHLANDLDLLTNLRTGLRVRMSESPLCDPTRFTQGLEAAYRHMWKTWCASQTTVVPTSLARA